MVVHYNSSEHDISQISFIVIEKISTFQNHLHLEQLLLTREAYWTSQLFTLNPHGLNKRREFRSKNRINYVTNQTLLVNTIVAYLVLFCFAFSLAVNYYQLLHLFSRSKAPMVESVISLGSCLSGTLRRDFITIV